MDLLMNFTKLELLWICITGMYVMKGIVNSVFGWGSTDSDFGGSTNVMRISKRSMMRWVLGIIWNAPFLYYTYRSYISSVHPYHWMTSLINSTIYAPHTSTDCMSVVIAYTLLYVHILRRAHQAIFRSVNTDTTQNLLDALSPILYTLTCGLVILSAGPPLTMSAGDWMRFSSIKMSHIVSVSLFVFLTYIDKGCQTSLMRCRKNKAGHIVTDEHKIPRDGLFELVSCPHFFTEVLFNLCIGMTLGLSHRPWWILIGYVVVSHVVRAKDRHQWYRKTYKEYPPTRSSILPYVY